MMNTLWRKWTSWPYFKHALIGVLVGGELTHFTMEHIVAFRTAAGPSMLPTMSMHEYAIEEKIRHEWFPQKLQRGDIVTYRAPYDPNALVCKRIIGLPGDTILIDPTTLPDPLSRAQSSNTRKEHVVIPKGHLWVQGDNAPASRDSRMYGPIPIALITGRLICGWGTLPGPIKFKWYRRPSPVSIFRPS